MSSLPNNYNKMQTYFEQLDNKQNACGILYIAITNTDPEFAEIYKTHIHEHNNKIMSEKYFNSGFDLFVPKDVILNGTKSTMVSMEVKCEMQTLDGKPLSYYMYPRSSISKTPLMLANHVGIIDSGYRGELIGAFRNLDSESYTIQKHNRLLQVCHPELKPIYVRLVNESKLSNTERGEGGFGSTGK
jgi:dUTP pyrophosphatase